MSRDDRHLFLRSSKSSFLIITFVITYIDILWGEIIILLMGETLPAETSACVEEEEKVTCAEVS